MINFRNIEYLKHGNERQRSACHTLIGLGIFEVLKEFTPTLVGTIPIEIDIEKSDLDIICCCENHVDFMHTVSQYFAHQPHYFAETKIINEVESTIINFQANAFAIEVFVQNIPVERQNAYRHMLIEHHILEREGESFRKEIINLKKNGWKTEPAFAKLLGLEGNPYEALLELENE